MSDDHDDENNVHRLRPPPLSSVKTEGRAKLERLIEDIDFDEVEDLLLVVRTKDSNVRSRWSDMHGMSACALVRVADIDLVNIFLSHRSK